MTNWNREFERRMGQWARAMTYLATRIGLSILAFVGLYIAAWAIADTLRGMSGHIWWGGWSGLAFTTAMIPAWLMALRRIWR